MAKFLLCFVAVFFYIFVTSCNLIDSGANCPPDNFFTMSVEVSAILNDPIPLNTAPYADLPLHNIPFRINLTKCIQNFGQSNQIDTIMTDSSGHKTIIYKDLKENFCEGTSCQPRLLIEPTRITDRYILWEVQEEQSSKTVTRNAYIYKPKCVLAVHVKRDTADVNELFLSASQSQFGRLKIVNPTTTLINKNRIDTLLYFNMVKGEDVQFYIAFDKNFYRTDTIKINRADTVFHLLKL